jgi:DNA-directed RNA polymerase subunit beta'
MSRQEIVITEDDCGTDRGFLVHDLRNEDGTMIEGLRDRIIGRFASSEIVGSLKTVKY